MRSESKIGIVVAVGIVSVIVLLFLYFSESFDIMPEMIWLAPCLS